MGADGWVGRARGLTKVSVGDDDHRPLLLGSESKGSPRASRPNHHTQPSFQGALQATRLRTFPSSQPLFYGRNCGSHVGVVPDQLAVTASDDGVHGPDGLQQRRGRVRGGWGGGQAAEPSKT